MNPAFKALPAAFANRKCRFRRRLPYVLFSSLFLLPFLGFTGYAQCPNGKPQHPVYGCGERPSTTPTPTPTRRPRSTPPAGGRCKIQIRINTQEENQPL